MLRPDLLLHLFSWQSRYQSALLSSQISLTLYADRRKRLESVQLVERNVSEAEFTLVVQIQDVRNSLPASSQRSFLLREILQVQVFKERQPLDLLCHF